jgi:tetratricopeptide (TPR) repeat protein
MPIRRPFILLAALALACAGQPVRVEGPVEQTQTTPGKPGDKSAPTGPIIPKLTARGQRLFDEAVAAHEEQKRLKVPTDWAALEKKWKAVLSAEDVPEAHYNLGVIYERTRRPAEARAAYERALRLKPTLREAAVNLAVMMEGEGNTQAALQTYQGVLKKYPEDATSRVRLAALYHASGQLDEAWRFAREALMRDPKAAGAYKVMMKVALERGNLSMAKLLALRALKLDDRDPALYYFVGQILVKEEDEPGALVQFRKALAQRDDFMPARHELLKMALKKQNWEGVIEQAGRILKYEPKNAEMYLNLGVAYRYLNQPDKAMLAYDQAEKLSGDRLPATHLNRGLVLMKVKNQCEAAMKEFDKAVSGGIAGESNISALQQECEAIVTANRQAEEAAKQMKEEEARQKREEAEQKKAGGDGKGGKDGKDGKDKEPGKKDDDEPPEAAADVKPAGGRSRADARQVPAARKAAPTSDEPPSDEPASDPDEPRD